MKPCAWLRKRSRRWGGVGGSTTNCASTAKRQCVSSHPGGHEEASVAQPQRRCCVRRCQTKQSPHRSRDDATRARTARAPPRRRQSAASSCRARTCGRGMVWQCALCHRRAGRHGHLCARRTAERPAAARGPVCHPCDAIGHVMSWRVTTRGPVSRAARHTTGRPASGACRVASTPPHAGRVVWNLRAS